MDGSIWHASYQEQGVQWQSHFASICHLFRNHGPFSQAFTLSPAVPHDASMPTGRPMGPMGHLRLAMCRRIMGAMEHDQRGDPLEYRGGGLRHLAAQRGCCPIAIPAQMNIEITHTHAHIIHTCIHAYVHTCIHAYMHACMHTDRQTHIDTQIDKHIDTHMDTHIDTHRYT